jgi:hypothetical protein
LHSVFATSARQGKKKRPHAWALLQAEHAKGVSPGLVARARFELATFGL